MPNETPSFEVSSDSIPATQLAWERTCSPAITSDVIWKLDAYRAALFFLNLARGDRRVVVKSGLGYRVADQLLGAVGSISANLAEGYSRGTSADRLRFLSYALGSARESVTWYYASIDALTPETVENRFALIARNRTLILGLIRSTRNGNASHRPFEP